VEEIEIVGITHKGRAISYKKILPATEKQRNYIRTLCGEIRDLLRFFVVEKQNKYAIWPWPPDAHEWSNREIAGIDIEAPDLPQYYAGGVIADLREKVLILRRRKREYYNQERKGDE